MDPIRGRKMTITRTEATKLVSALAQFHQDVGGIEKTARAQYGAYSDLAVVLQTVTPALSRNGLVLLQGFEDVADARYLRTQLIHTSGETLSSVCRLVETESANRNNPLHVWGGSVTYQRRYCALALLGLAAGMEDDDGEIATPVKAPAKASTGPIKKKPIPSNVDPYDSVEFALEDIKVAASIQTLARIADRLAVSNLIGADLDNARNAYKEKAAKINE